MPSIPEANSAALSSAAPDSAAARIRELVETFAAHEKTYKATAYQEAEVRKDFIDPFFTALGWYVLHQTQRNPHEQEVKVERGQHQVGGTAQRKADYAFYFQPNFRDPRFYVEAKKPSVELATADSYFQTIRYGWNANTPLAVLTDFEQFHVLDCRYSPDIDSAIHRAVVGPDGFHYTFHYRDYLDPEKLARIYWLFSREALATGALARFAENLPKPKGRGRQLAFLKAGDQKPDEFFLADLERHREALARSLKNENSTLDGEALTEITQRILDRLVFFRFLEDKLIETRFRVADLLANDAPWPKFLALSRTLDATYNGVVFKEHPLIDSSHLVMDAEVF